MSKGIIIDLDRCIGCDACTIACKQGNGTPKGTFWTHVERAETGIYPDAYLEQTPVMCNHCKNAACVEVCQYSASYYAEDGTVQIHSDICVGCNFCIAACPYGARTFDFGEWNGYFKDEEDYFTGESLYNAQEQLKEARKPYRHTVSKCTLCEDKRAEGELPRCAYTCPADARTYYDDVDAAAVQILISSRRGYRQKMEHGTEPNVYYLPRKVPSERNYNSE